MSLRGGGGNLHGSVAFAVEEAKRMDGDLTDATRLHVLHMLRTHMLGEGDDGLVWAEMVAAPPQCLSVDAEGVEAGERNHAVREHEERSDRGGHRDEKRRDKRRDHDDRRDDRRRNSSRKGRDGHREREGVIAGKGVATTEDENR